jgi:hypothetical protein
MKKHLMKISALFRLFYINTQYIDGFSIFEVDKDIIKSDKVYKLKQLLQ